MGEKFKITQEFAQGYDWIQSHRADLHKKYQGQWVAVYIDRVVASGKSFGSVEQKAIQLTGVQQTKIPLIYMEDPHCIYSCLR